MPGHMFKENQQDQTKQEHLTLAKPCKALHSFTEPIPPCLTSCPLRPDRITPGKAPPVHDMEANASLVHLDG